MITRVAIPYSAKFWWGTLANRSFQNFGEGNVGEFTIANIAVWNLVGFLYWRMVFDSSNSPKFSPTKILRYMVLIRSSELCAVPQSHISHAYKL